MAKNILSELSNAMADAVEKAGRSTVLVDARRRIPASGIALSKELVLTASHVVEVDEDILVILPDGRELSAEILGRDPGSDLALLKLEKAGAVPMESDGDPRIGQLVLALGRPTSGGVQASLGVVSAVGGPTRTRRGGMLEKYVRTDAVPYPGFSGGPLVDVDGKVVGINTSGLGHGSSLAIPIELAKKIADSLEKHGSVKRGYLGIRSQMVEVAEEAQKALGREQAQGLLIVSLEEDSPAAAGGLLVGDIIVGLNGESAESHDELMALLTGEVVGQDASAEVLRGGTPKTVKVTIAERKESPRRRRYHGPHVMYGVFGRDHRSRRGHRPRRSVRGEKQDDEDD
ncbi:MAG: trypsin-like peptidase domain-containing protein [Anaerolineales bacterium]|jgi:S1-C subfamily serine protease